jgi:hypothetical protein
MTRMKSELDLLRQPLPTIRSHPDLSTFTYAHVSEASVKPTWTACFVLAISSNHG